MTHMGHDSRRMAHGAAEGPLLRGCSRCARTVRWRALAWPLQLLALGVGCCSWLGLLLGLLLGKALWCWLVQYRAAALLLCTLLVMAPEGSKSHYLVTWHTPWHIIIHVGR